jgi:uncharacterized Fe-S cluster-containing radical SAM superfamily protein
MEPVLPFNPIERSLEVEKLVMRGRKRVYHRFRGAPYYGGIATADAVGCSFLCAYCWNYFKNLYPQKFKEFYSPQQVGAKLLDIARKKSYRLFRITGAEPILGEDSLSHLVEVVQIIFQSMPESLFVLETNGFYLGYNPEVIPRLKFKNILIRISLKGTDEESFGLISGAKKKYFTFPIIALKELERQGIRTRPALMFDLFSEDEMTDLKKTLKDFGVISAIEFESLEAYPHVVENLRKRKIRFF